MVCTFNVGKALSRDELDNVAELQQIADEELDVLPDPEARLSRQSSLGHSRVTPSGGD